jgi:hypothetical protein
MRGFWPGLPLFGIWGAKTESILGVLQLAYAFEQASGFWKQKPPVVLK